MRTNLIGNKIWDSIRGKVEFLCGNSNWIKYAQTFERSTQDIFYFRIRDITKWSVQASIEKLNENNC